MSSLRKRMREDMRIRNLSWNTQRSYINCVAAFARYFGKSPDELGPEEIRRYQLYLLEEKRWQPSSVHNTLTALKNLETREKMIRRSHRKAHQSTRLPVSRTRTGPSTGRPGPTPDVQSP